MIRFKDGDKVKIIDVPDDKNHLLGKTGRAEQPKGSGYEDDDVIVWFEEGANGYFKEHQLEKA